MSSASSLPLNGLSASREPGVPREEPRAEAVSSAFIVGPAYDWLLFLGTPLAALLAGFLISGSSFAGRAFEFHGYEVTRAGLMLGILVHAHIAAVFFRSHGNPQIFRAHRIPFLVVPVVLYAAMMASPWLLIGASVTATFWDVYHSGMQTFGFGRMYDRKAGNDPLVGRRLDWVLNVLLYTGPIVGGETMIDHFGDFDEFQEVGDVYFTRIPAAMEGIHGTLSVVVVVLGTLFLVGYGIAYWRLSRQGYRVAWLKVWIYASTGVTSIYAWGFNAFGEAFFIMNLFHAVQYFGIVWAREKDQMAARFRLSNRRLGKPFTLVLFLTMTGAYCYWVESLDTDITSLWAITILASLLHFWYDGFIWSVRRREV
jgi:hypothetical protein